jgi:hypothetical protein
LDAISYTILLLLHSYMTLERFSSTVQPYEIVLALWFLSLLVDEIRQVCHLSLKHLVKA